MAVSGSVSASVNLYDARSVGVTSGGQSSKLPGVASQQFSFADGAAALQGNVLYAATRVLGGSSEDLDLSGVLSDLYGSTVTMARVKTIYVKNNSSSATLTLGSASSNQWATLLNSTGTLTLRPGAFVLVGTPDATGWTVTASTGDLLKVAGTTSESYDIVLLGAST